MSVDPPAASEELRRRLDFEIAFVSDAEGTLMDALGVRDRGGAPPPSVTGAAPDADIFLPTTFLLDGDGIVRWVYRPGSYRMRASATDVLAAIDRAQQGAAP